MENFLLSYTPLSMQIAFRWRIQGTLVHLLGPISFIFTARKRSLGQDNVYTPVCQSFRSRRAYTSLGRHSPRQTPPRQTPLQADTPLGRHTLGRHPPLRRQLKPALHILLECILVPAVFSTKLTR